MNHLRNFSFSINLLPNLKAPGYNFHCILLLLVATFLLGSCCKMGDEYESDKDRINYQDNVFMNEIAVGNLEIIDAGQYGLAKSTESLIHNYAQLLVHDYGNAHSQLKVLAADMTCDIPADVSDSYSVRKDLLSSLSGTGFDTAWLSQQSFHCRRNVAAMEKEMAGGNNVRMKSYAATYIDRTRRHLQIADSLFLILK